MTDDRSYVERNARALERMRAIVERVGEAELTAPVNEFWTVAGVLGHIAFWDGRALALAEKLERASRSRPPTTSPRTSTGSTTPRVR